LHPYVQKLNKSATIIVLRLELVSNSVDKENSLERKKNLVNIGGSVLLCKIYKRMFKTMSSDVKVGVAITLREMMIKNYEII